MDTGRRQSVDLMRIVAAFGIVWAHMGAPGAIFGYLALALFVVLAGFLAVRTADRSPGRGFVRSRLRRLLGPWLVWSALYLLLESVRAGDPSRLWQLTDPASLLIGPLIHLWFLPFLALAAPLAVIVARRLDRPSRLTVAAVALAPVGAAAIWLHDSGRLGEPFVQWAFAVTPLLYGTLAAAGRGVGRPLAPLVFVLLACLPPVLVWGSVMAPFLISAALVFEAVWRTGLTGRVWPALGSAAFGVYILHPALMLVWYRLVPGGPAALGAPAVFAAALCLSLGAARLRRIAPFAPARPALWQGS